MHDTTVGGEQTDATLHKGQRNGTAMARAGAYLYLLLADCSRPGSHTICADFLRIVDISNPAVPGVVADLPIYDAHYQTPGGEQIVVADNRVYISSIQGLHILDVSDPATPLVLDQQTDANHIAGNRLAIDGTRLYLTHWAGRFLVVDASDAGNLTTVNDISWTGGAGPTLVHENVLFVW